MIDAQLLILDEATSQIDIEAEGNIFDLVHSLQNQLTILIVAHRLTAIKSVDNIIIVEEGRIINQGNHSELSSYSNFYSNH